MGDSADLERDVHRCIDAVTKGIEGFSFNKSVAALYTLTNALAKSEAPKSARRAAMLDLVVLMNPFHPPFGRGNLAKTRWQRFDCAGRLASSKPQPFARNKRHHPHPSQRQTPRRNIRICRGG